jgi:hypothetical protein
LLPLSQIKADICCFQRNRYCSPTEKNAARRTFQLIARPVPGELKTLTNIESLLEIAGKSTDGPGYE